MQVKLGNDTIRLNHPVREYLSAYFNIAPLDRDGDGEPEWSEYFEGREKMLDELSPEVKTEVLAEIDRNTTEYEKTLRRMQRGAMGAYWRINDKVAEETGTQDLLRDIEIARYSDPALAEALNKTPQAKRFRKESQRQKERMRMLDPELDYALFAFGFTTSTKNPTAAAWWANGSGVQRNVPWIGYLNGKTP